MENLDQSLFVFLNSSLSNSLFDAILVPLTDLHKNILFLSTVFPVILGLWIYKKRLNALLVLLGLVLCIGFTDNFTYRILKPSFKRARPPQVETVIKLRTDRYAGYSFPSNHAANNFAGATFLSFCYPALTPLLYAVASLVALSRVYVGVHYPGDVLAGGFLGVIFGLFFFNLWVIILMRLKGRWPNLPVSTRSKDRGGLKNG